MNDLFDTPELIPKEVNKILNTFDDNEDAYKELHRIEKELNTIGYTFDYYLDACPYNLRKL